MKLLLIFLLPFTFYAQSQDSLEFEYSELRFEIEDQREQIEMLNLKLEEATVTIYQLSKLQLENETLRRIMSGYVHQIDSLNTMDLKQSSEIDLLSTELEKLIKRQGVTSITDRKRLTETSMESVFVEEEIFVRMKLYINSEGHVVLVKVLNTTGVQDLRIVDLIVANVKRDIHYEPVEDIPFQMAFYTIKIIP